jgi:4-hydroxy-2-oxoheptanedioate aldolase
VARPNPLRRTLHEKRGAVGCIVSMRGADSAEILAHAGFDFLMLDHEHGPGSVGDAIDQMRSMKGTSVASMVRVPPGESAHLQRILDAGADCIVFPGVHSPDAARALVRSCRYPPAGSRGLGLGTRATLYGHEADYAHDELLLAVQVESLKAVERIEEIAAIAGIDALLIGPRDLSADLGCPNVLDDPRLHAVIEVARQRIEASGKLLGSALQSGKTIAQMFEQGYRLVVAGSDASILARAAGTIVRSV